jgi:hypothetical protein
MSGEWQDLLSALQPTTSELRISCFGKNQLAKRLKKPYIISRIFYQAMGNI